MQLKKKFCVANDVPRHQKFIKIMFLSVIFLDARIYEKSRNVNILYREYWTLVSLCCHRCTLYFYT